LQSSPDLLAVLPVLLRQAVAQRPVGKAQLESGSEAGGVQSPAVEVLQRFRALLQGLVVVLGDLGEEFGIGGLRVDGKRQLRHRRVLGRRRWIAGEFRVVGPEDLHRVPEAHAFGRHHPVHHRAALATGAEAVPEVLLRRDDQRRILVVVKRTQTNKVVAMRLELHPTRLRQPPHRNLPLQPLEFVLRDPSHGHHPTKEILIVIFR
jgi:hypothetical protein